MAPAWVRLDGWQETPEPNTQGSGAKGNQSARAHETTGLRAPGRARPGNAKGVTRVVASWRFPLGAIPATYIPARPETVPSTREESAAPPAYSSPTARWPQLTCLAPPPQASSAPPRPGTEDSPHLQPIARRAGIGGGSDANVRQSQARLLKLQANGEAADPPRPCGGRGKGGTCGVSGRGGRAGT